MIYFDNAATTPLLKSVKQITSNLSNDFANPSSRYQLARDEYYKITEARQQILDLLDADPSLYNIYFTSGATESDNWALRAMTEAGRGQNKTGIVTTGIEHPAVYKTALALQRQAYDVKFINPDTCGVVKACNFEDVINSNTAIVSTMAVNNLMGTIQPLEDIGRLCKTNSVPFHVDATQAIGKQKIDLEKNNIALMSGSAHKFGGLKGIGFLLCRRDIDITPLLYGGKQNVGKRAGTENVLGILTMAAALKDSFENFEYKREKVQNLSDTFLFGILSNVRTCLNGDSLQKVPDIINVSFLGIEQNFMADLLEAHHILVSTASACETGVKDSDYVFRNCGFPQDRISSSIRISLSADNTIDECKTVAQVINKIQNGSVGKFI